MRAHASEGHSIAGSLYPADKPGWQGKSESRGHPGLGDTVVCMFATMSATDVAFSLVAEMQAVLALVWLIGGVWAGEVRRAAWQWAAYAGLSAMSFVLLTLAMRSAGLGPSEPLRAELLRAAGNVSGVLAIMALRRGVWIFLGRNLRPSIQPGLIAAVLVVAWLGLDPARGALRVGFNSLVLTWLCLDIARALHVHARSALHFRREPVNASNTPDRPPQTAPLVVEKGLRLPSSGGASRVDWLRLDRPLRLVGLIRRRLPMLLALPMLIAAFGYGQRGARAVLDPASVAASMTTHSALNVGSAFFYVILALAFHAMLMVLVVARLVAQLHQLSQRDGLTGLLNRRAMQEALDGQMRRSRRDGQAFALMMLDADHFKAINDQHGHGVGDQVLMHLSTLLNSGMREVDRLARFGGEEFLVLMPGATLAEAASVAERLRWLVANTPMTDVQPRVAVSISIGIAEWGGAAEDLSRLLARTDAALYRAKQHGRDRVALAEAPVFAVPAM